MPRFTPALSKPQFFFTCELCTTERPPSQTGNSFAGQPASPPTPPAPCLAGGGAAAAGSTHHAVSGGDDGLSVTSGHIYLFVFAALFLMAVLGAAAHCVVRHKGSQLAKLLERCSSGGERPSIEGGIEGGSTMLHQPCTAAADAAPQRTWHAHQMHVMQCVFSQHAFLPVPLTHPISAPAPPPSQPGPKGRQSPTSCSAACRSMQSSTPRCSSRPQPRGWQLAWRQRAQQGRRRQTGMWLCMWWSTQTPR